MCNKVFPKYGFRQAHSLFSKLAKRELRARRADRSGLAASSTNYQSEKLLHNSTLEAADRLNNRDFERFRLKLKFN